MRMYFPFCASFTSPSLALISCSSQRRLDLIHLAEGLTDGRHARWAALRGERWRKGRTTSESALRVEADNQRELPCWRRRE